MKILLTLLILLCGFHNIYSQQDRRTPIRAAEIQLTSQSSNSTSVDFWKNLQTQQLGIPYDWEFVNSNQEIASDTISLVNAGLPEILRYNVFSLRITGSNETMRIDEALMLHQFLEGGGFVWVNLLGDDESVAPFLKSFPWPTVWSDVTSLDAISNGTLDFPVYPDSLNQEDLDTLKALKVRLLKVGNGYVLFTQSNFQEDPAQHPVRGFKSVHPVVKLIMNTLNDLLSFPSLGHSANQTFSAMIDIQLPLYRHRSLTYNDDSITVEHAPIFFRDRAIAVVKDHGIRKLRVWRLWNLPPLKGSSKYPDLSTPFWDIMGDASIPDNDPIVATPVCCDQTGMILLLSKSHMYLYQIDTFTNHSTPQPTSMVNLASDTPPIENISPTIHEGIAYMVLADTNGGGANLYMYDIIHAEFLTRGGAEKLTAPVTGATASPTVGYVPAKDNSGAFDLIALVPVSTNEASGIRSVWIGARSERVRAEIDPKKSDILTLLIRDATSEDKDKTSPRAFAKPRTIYTKADKNPNFKPRLTIVTEDGKVIRYTPSKVESGNDGRLKISIKKELTEENLGTKIKFDKGSVLTMAIYLDYYIDPQKKDSLYTFNFPKNDNKYFKPTSSLALSPYGTLFAVAGTEDFSQERSNGVFYGFLPVYNRGPIPLYRWDLYENITVARPGGSEKMTYANPLRTMKEGRDFRNLIFNGSPVISGDTVYMAVNALENNLPVSLILGFKANPQAFSFFTGYSDARGTVTRVYQNNPIPLSKKTKSFSTISISIQPDLNESKESTDDAKDKKITLLSLVAASNVLSTDIPVFVQTTSKTVLINPEATEVEGSMFPGGANGHWSPLIFVSDTIKPNPKAEEVQEQVVLSQLIAFGDSLVFVAGKQNGKDSALYSIDTRFEKQTYMEASPLLNVPLNIESTKFEITGGSGSLFAWTPKSLDTLVSTDLILASSSRISKFTNDGRRIWEVAGTTIEQDNVKETIPFSLPVRVYQDPNAEGEYWAVDAGGNRIVSFDHAGTQLKSIGGFITDPLNTFLYQSNSTSQIYAKDLPNNPATQLRQPRDVSLFQSQVPKQDNFFSNPQQLEDWQHFLIADTENKRLIELVDRVNAKNQELVDFRGPLDASLSAFNVLLWYSPPDFNGSNATYNSIDRVELPEVGPLLAFGFAGQQTGVVLYEPQEDIKGILSNFEIPPGEEEHAAPATTHILRGLRSATLALSTKNGDKSPAVHLLIVDTTGIYELSTKSDTDLSKPANWALQWRLLNSDLSQLLGIKEAREVIYAKRQPSGDLLIVYNAPEGEVSHSGVALFRGSVTVPKEGDLLFKIDTELNQLPIFNIQHAIVEY